MLELYRSSKIIFIPSAVELRVIQLKAILQQRPTSLISQQYNGFHFPFFEHKTHLLCGSDFSVFGAIFPRKFLSVNRGTVLSSACRPITLRFSVARSYFVNSPSTNWILYESCCRILPVTSRQTTNELRTAEFSGLLQSLRYHLVILFPLDLVHVQQIVLQIDSPYVMIIISHTQRLLCILAFVRNPLCFCIIVFCHHRYISFVTLLLLWLDPKVKLWFIPFPFYYFSFPWGRTFCSVLVCQTQSAEFSIFSFLANFVLLKKLSVHNVCPQTNKCFKVTVLQLLLGVSGRSEC